MVLPLYLKRLFRKTLIKLGVGKIVGKIFRFSDIVSLDEQSIDAERNFLLGVNPCKNMSAIRKNNVVNPEDAKFDVQFIVPTYNSEKYIAECIDSVILPEKNFTFFVTVINDGSTDKTSEILKKYDKNPCIEIIEQENRGFSGARNRGLENIRGRYVSFLDSDDRVDCDGVGEMLKTAAIYDADIVEGTHTVIYDNGKNKYTVKHKSGIIDKNKDLRGEPWGKIIRASMFENLVFPEGLWFEDTIDAMLLYPRARTVCGIKENVYFYRHRAGSISNTSAFNNKSVDSLWVLELLDRDREKIGLAVNQEYYEFFLSMAKLTVYRNQYLQKRIQRAVFTLLCNFYEKKFPGFKTENKKFKMIEKALAEHNFGVFRSLSVWC